jgi:hypothetical protein
MSHVRLTIVHENSAYTAENPWFVISTSPKRTDIPCGSVRRKSDSVANLKLYPIPEEEVDLVENVNWSSNGK